MSVIEDRIVSMKFDNKQFQAGARVTMSTLAALKNSLNFGGAKKGIDDVQNSVGRFNMGPMGTAVEGVSAKFLALSTVALTALSNITNRAIDTGVNLAKSLTIQPITDGFAEYELKMGSIQTILANTSRHGTGLKEVTASLDDLNTYADKTIYNFGDMTRNIGLFTNAGIGVEDATSMIKGFSNEAAASGTSSQGAAGAAYQLSQALSAGTIRLMDWRSLTNVGMGNKNMQNGIIEIAEAMGELDKAGISATDIQNDFNGSLEKNWLSADVMSKYLGIMAGDIDAAAMASMGLTEEQIRMFETQQTNAEEAATKVRTWTQLIGTLQEAVGSSWAQTFDILLGDFEAATELFTGIEQTLSPMIGAFGDARNELLSAWADRGGRLMAIEGLKNIFTALKNVLIKVGQAFRQIFPAMNVDQLLSLTSGFRRFTESLIASGETLGKIRRTFAGVFAIFGIGWEVVKGLFSVFMQLFGGIQSGAGGFLSLTASLGDWLVAVHEAISSGDGLQNLFSGLGSVLTLPISLISGMASGISALLPKLSELGAIAKMVFDILFSGDYKGGPFEEDSAIVDTLFDIREAMASSLDAVKNFMSGLGDLFSFDNLAAVLGIGAAGGLGLAIRKLLKDGISFGFGGTDSLFDSMIGAFDGVKAGFESVSGTFDSLTGALTTMQNNVKADILLKIAAAVGILSVSLKLLSTIEGVALAQSLGAITASFGMLLGAMAILAKIAGGAGFLAIPSIATAMVSLSIAVLILATAVKTLSSLSWEELFVGLAGLGGILAGIVVTAALLAKVQGPMLRTGLAMIPLAIGIKILASAVTDLASLSWGQMIIGLTGLGVSMVAIAGALRLMPDNMAATGAGLLLVGAGIFVVAQAISTMGSMSIGDLAQGIGGMAVALAAIAVALKFMPATLPAMGAGLLLVAGALTVVAGVIQALGAMDVGTMIQGLIGMGAALGILAIGLSAMTASLAGSAALVIAAFALALLIPPLLMMSAISWGDLIKGLLGLAGILTIIGVAGALITPVVPTLIGLGAALLMLGIGFGAAGLGAQAFATAISMMIGLIDQSKNSLIGLMDMIPLMAARLAEGILAFATTIASNAATFAGAFKDLILALLDAIIEIQPRIGEALNALLQMVLQIIITNAPLIGQAFITIMDTIMTVISTNIPRIVDGVMQLMTNFLNTIAQRIPEVAAAATNVVVAFINSIAANLPQITNAGMNLIITFINSLANTIAARSGEMRAAGRNLAIAIVDGMTGGLASAVGRVASKAAEMARSALNAAKAALGVESPSKEFKKVGKWSADGLIEGLEESGPRVEKAGMNMASNLLNGFTKGIGKAGPNAIDSIFKTLESGTRDFKFWGPHFAASDQLMGMHHALKQVNLQMAAMSGEVNMLDPKSVEEFSEKAGNSLSYLSGMFSELKGAATDAFTMLSEGKGLDQVLGSEDVLSQIVNGLIALLPGVEGAAVSVGLAVVDGLLSTFMGPGTTLIGIVGDFLSGAVRWIGGLFGIQFPPLEEDVKEADKAVEDFLVTVEDGQGRIQKLTEEGIEALKETLVNANELMDVENEPRITPILDLTKFNKGRDEMLKNLPSPDISPSMSSNQAATLNSREQELSDNRDVSNNTSASTTIEYNQYNSSPKALSHTEIYRQTKSQLSLTRDALGV